MKWMLLPAALSAGLLFAADAKDDAVKKDMDALQGKWQITALTRDGKDAEVSKDAVRIVKDNKYTVNPNPNTTIEGTFKIDPTTKPKSIDITQTNGPNAGKTSLGVYDLDGDTLKICWAPPGKDRPTDFKSAEGSGVLLAVHKKVKE
ncbi:MAG TPA: TIGR03067 domain-containing protein [Gemmataceae bacterium]|nr:TIGR03067 domain-containing protein [Gemmataceae bacterium]